MITYEEELSNSFETVLREADALYSGHGRLQRTCERLAARLNELAIAHSLVGGYAVFMHGLRRFTEDVDMLIRAADLEVLRTSLIERGYQSVPGSSRSIRDIETRVRIDFVLSGEFPGDGKPKPLAFPEPGATADKAQPLRVVDLRTLIELKLAAGMTGAGRLQDLADAQRLIALHCLTPDYAVQLDTYVRSKFLELCSAQGEADKKDWPGTRLAG